MKTYARIANNKVAEIVTLPDDLAPAALFHDDLIFVDCDSTVDQAWTYDAETRTFTAPLPIPVDPVTQFSSLDFMTRLTQAELTALSTAALGNAAILLVMMRWSAAEYIDVKDAKTIAAIDALIAAKLLAPERKQAILATA